MRFLHDTFEIALQTGRLLLANRLYKLLLMALLGAAVLTAAMHTQTPHPGRSLFAIMCWWLLGVVLLPWSTMYFAVQAIHGDIEDRTVQYLFLRPVSRAALLLGKWLAVAAIMGATAAVGVAGVFAAARMSGDWGGDAVFDAVLVFEVGMILLVVVLSAVAAVFSACFRWPLVWSTGYVVFVQTMMAFLPAKASIRGVSAADPVRRWLLYGLDADRRLARELWPTEREWGDDLVGQPLLHLTVIGVVCLAIALVFYTRREYDSRPRE